MWPQPTFQLPSKASCSTRCSDSLLISWKQVGRGVQWQQSLPSSVATGSSSGGKYLLSHNLVEGKANLEPCYAFPWTYEDHCMQAPNFALLAMSTSWDFQCPLLSRQWVVDSGCMDAHTTISRCWWWWGKTF